MIGFRYVVGRTEGEASLISRACQQDMIANMISETFSYSCDERGTVEQFMHWVGLANTDFPEQER